MSIINEDENELNNESNIKTDNTSVQQAKQITDERLSEDKDDQDEINIKTKFHKKLINLLTKYNQTFETANIWMLNQLIIPLQQGSAQNSQQIKLRYLTPENDFICYNTTTTTTQQQQIDNPNESIHNVSIDETALTIHNKKSAISRLHIHTCYAFNQNGTYSIPLVVFPKNELDANCTQALKQTTIIDETTIGDINEQIFYNWLSFFIKQAQSVTQMQQKPLILMCNSIIPINSKETIQLCIDNNVYLLFYPLDDQCEIFNKSIFLKFKDAWKLVLQQYAMKDNPHSQLSFLFVYKQVLRKILTFESIKECFRDFLKIYRLPKTLCSTINNENENGSENGNTAVTLLTQSSSCSSFNQQPQLQADPIIDLNCVSDDCNPTAALGSLNQQLDQDNDEQSSNLQILNQNTQQSSNNNSNNIKFTEQEINEYCEWIKFMSNIGCLCVKYTFLRDLSLKYRLTLTKSSKEVCASEKKWLDLIKKNKQKFYDSNTNQNGTLSNVFCFNEDEYLTKWFDIDMWRCLYYRLLKEKQITNPASIWTFDLIQFPCLINNNNLLRAPERDVNRPRNIKPRISVLFCFNAAGDYIQPYIVYPLNFMIDNNNDDLASNECYSQNGYINCKIFNIWLTQIFMPYLKQQQESNKVVYDENLILLYCSKLAVVDYQNMKYCQENKINLFNLTHDSIQPFNCLFQKNLRKRQTDLFLDSWRKITAKQNLSYQFKCKSKLEFRNLFMDTFQNCIEEIGDFKMKLINTFEISQLWPINEDEYKVYLMNSEMTLNKQRQLMNSSEAVVVNGVSSTIKQSQSMSTLESAMAATSVTTPATMAAPLTKQQENRLKRQSIATATPTLQQQPQVNGNGKLNSSKTKLNTSNNSLNKKTTVRRKNKTNSYSDDDESEESDHDSEEDENDSDEEDDFDDDIGNNDDTFDDIDSEENDLEYNYENNGNLTNGNYTSDEEFLPSTKRRRISDSPAVNKTTNLNQQLQQSASKRSSRIQMQISTQNQLQQQQQQQQQQKLQATPVRNNNNEKSINNHNNQQIKSYSLADLLNNDLNLVSNIKNIIENELIKYFNETKPAAAVTPSPSPISRILNRPSTDNKIKSTTTSASVEHFEKQIINLKSLLNDLVKCLLSDQTNKNGVVHQAQQQPLKEQSLNENFNDYFNSSSMKTSQNRCDLLKIFIKQLPINTDVAKFSDLLIKCYNDYNLADNYEQQQQANQETTTTTVNNIDLKNLTDELLFKNKIENLDELNISLNNILNLYSKNLDNAFKFLKEFCFQSKNSLTTTQAFNIKKFNFIKDLMFKLYSNFLVNNNECGANWSKCISIIDENL